MTRPRKRPSKNIPSKRDEPLMHDFVLVTNDLRMKIKRLEKIERTNTEAYFGEHEYIRFCIRTLSAQVMFLTGSFKDNTEGV